MRDKDSEAISRRPVLRHCNACVLDVFTASSNVCLNLGLKLYLSHFYFIFEIIFIEIVSVDVHPDWPNCILTSSSDGTVRKFDLRCSYQDESQNHDHEIGLIIPQQYLGGPCSRRDDFKETLVVDLSQR